MKWISWVQPTEDHRPINFPPTESVLAWWCTGEKGGDTPASTLVALVDAEDEDAAKSAVLCNWPEATEWRFCEDKSDKKFSSRFPVSYWMKKRGCFNKD